MKVPHGAHSCMHLAISGGRLLHKRKHHEEQLTCIAEGMTGALIGIPTMGAACVAPTQAEEPLSLLTKP